MDMRSREKCGLHYRGARAGVSVGIVLTGASAQRGAEARPSGVATAVCLQKVRGPPDSHDVQVDVG